jgi:myo-inositol-1(or 4)-monophosphatase
LAGYIDIASEIAREAGAIQMSFLNRVAYESKGEQDLVTEADRASERLICERLRSHFPSHGIVAEEGGGHVSSSGYRWFVDPLDGTTNFAHGFPVFNVSIGLEKDGELIAGVIYDPTRNELFAAEKGAGAHLNNRPIKTSATRTLKTSLVSTGFPSTKRSQSVNIHFYYQISMISHGIRRAGAAAIDFAYVACGRLEAFWEFKLNPWDMAAGILIVREAGGTCSDMFGKPVDLYGEHVVADNSHIHNELIHTFGEIFDGKVVYPMPEINLKLPNP